MTKVQIKNESTNGAVPMGSDPTARGQKEDVPGRAVASATVTIPGVAGTCCDAPANGAVAKRGGLCLQRARQPAPRMPVLEQRLHNVLSKEARQHMPKLLLTQKLRKRPTRSPWVQAQRLVASVRHERM